MSIYADKNTKLVVQGITGREAKEKIPEMQQYGTKILAGVTPGKEGQKVEDIPVYNTVKKAKKQHPEINASLVYVPPFAAKEAVKEAINNNIKLINIVTENIPVKDAWQIHQQAKKNNVDIIGPTSVGIITPGETKIGPIGGNQPDKVYKPGKVGIISKSGGMTTETAWVLRQQNLGISTAIGLGGDQIPSTTFADALKKYENDPQTEAVVMFGEQGANYETKAAELLENGEFTKPLYVFIAGEFTEKLPSRQYGHAGAIIRGETDKTSYKKKKLREAGANVVNVHHKLGEKIKKQL